MVYVRSQYLLNYIRRGVYTCYWVFEPQISRLKLVMISAWTCDSLSWFQSTVVFTNNEFLIFSVWAVGTIKHLVLLIVVPNWTIHGLNELFWHAYNVTSSFCCCHLTSWTVLPHVGDGSHRYTTHTSIYLHSKYGDPNGLAKKTYKF